MSSVSVVIPNYNHASYLKERIDSVINQTFQDIEIIILDDCSTDESVTIIEQYRNHPKVKHIVYNDTNTGNTFKQWEKGISLAQSDWIWIAESDDWCELTLLAELYTNVMQQTNCVISYCQSIMVENNNVLWRSNTKRLAEYLPGAKFVDEFMLLGNAIFNASMCLFKKETFQKVSNEFKNYKLSGDWIFWIEVALQGEVFISGKSLNYFRKHQKDISSNAFIEGLIYIEYFSVLDYLEKLNLVYHKKQQLLVTKFNQFLGDNRITKVNKVQIKQLFKQKLGLKYNTTILAYNLKSNLKTYLKKLS